jgi:hypothetical protein
MGEGRAIATRATCNALPLHPWIAAELYRYPLAMFRIVLQHTFESRSLRIPRRDISFLLLTPVILARNNFILD